MTDACQILKSKLKEKTTPKLKISLDSIVQSQGWVFVVVLVVVLVVEFVAVFVVIAGVVVVVA